ncbi:MAG: hypothetical protein LBK65_10325 [Tannerellaceae bacterium]|jgi:hypothetical protein|nr:hypothetical protein [Tannerellaceae bacterium]
MKKIIILLVLPFILPSCFDEKAAPGFMNETVWGSNILGTAVRDGVEYSYMEIHTLTFSDKTFIHLLDRKETERKDGTSYKDAIKEEIEGTYVLDYPEITMTENGQKIAGTLSPDGVLIVDKWYDQSLIFIKKKIQK